MICMSFYINVCTELTILIAFLVFWVLLRKRIAASRNSPQGNDLRWPNFPSF